MQKFQEFLEKYFVPIAMKIGSNVYLNGIRDGCMITAPLMIIGSIFLLVAFLPLPGYAEFMQGIFGLGWQRSLLYPVNASFDVIAVLTTIGIGYRLGEKFKLDGIMVGVLSFVGFLIVTPFEAMIKIVDMPNEILIGDIIPKVWLGAKGLFVAIIVAIITTLIFRYVVRKNWVIKLPEGVPPAVMKSFLAIVPGFFAVVFFWALRVLFSMTNFHTVHEFVYKIVQTPLEHLGNTLPAIIIAYIACQMLWWFGIHGQMLVFNTVMGPILTALTLQNYDAFVVGQTLPNIFTLKFVDTFVMFGGSGCTLALVVVMAFMCKSAQIKDLGRMALPAGIFNINEPIIFGLPIVYNPIMFIPWILVPVVCAIVTYTAMSLGLCPLTNGVNIPWTMPMMFNAFFITGLTGVFWQLVNFVLAFLMYLPFIKMLDKQYRAQEQAVETEGV
ncbi:MAG: PTS cellobiose transporter subunit IIC [Negativicutes bacterium]|jgi:PTS system cellobiose-specific IIC component